MKCESHKAAFDLIHPRMMEYLLSIDTVHWQVRDNRIVLLQEKEFTPEQIVQRIEMIKQFVKLIPAYICKHP